MLLSPGSALAGTFTTDFSSQPAGVQLYGDPGDGTAGVIADGVLKLTTLVGSMTAGMVIDDLDAGAAVSGFTATFNLLIGGGSGADGFSFNFGGDVPDAGISEDGAGTGLSVLFDTYDNGGGEAPAIDLKIGGEVVATTKISPRSALAANKFLPVRINLDTDGTVDVSYGDMVIYTNLYTTFAATPGRFAFGARTGGSFDNHWVDDVKITTTTAPQTQPTHPLVVTNLPPASGNSPEATISVTIQDFTTKVKTSSVQLKVNGTAVTPTVTKTDNLTLVAFDPPGLFGPESVNTYEVVYSDDATPAVYTTNVFTFKVVAYNSVVLPTPIYLETFNTTPEGSLPNGWVQTNATDSLTAGIDFNDPNSDAYLGWTVVERSRFEGAPFDARRLNVAPGYLNGQLITNLVDGRSVYAESDNRGQNQIQMLFSPDFDLTGKTDVCLSYNSIYEQNQDSIGAVEYSIDQGKTWKPIIIMLDQPDIVLKADGTVDPVATLTTVQTDSPQVDDGTGTGTTRRTAYGEFLGSQDFAAMGPYLSGRVNDNPTESKRVELFRLPAADNQAKVRFRFVQAGTGSWYFGFDNFGLYSIPAPGANIAWVSFHPADNDPAANAKTAGFTEAPDVGYTKLLAAKGHKVTRFVTSGTPDVAKLNTFDLVIISRSVPSGDYQDPPETAAWNGITAPTMIMGGYILRNTRLGYTTGATIPDTANPVRLEVKNPAHAIFAGVALDATKLMVNLYANLVSYTNAVQRGISVNTDPVAGGGTILATIGTTGDPAVGGMVIGEWQAGAKMAVAAGDLLGGHRLVFLSGSREQGIDSQCAGMYDLTDDGAKLFLNAVKYMTQPVAPKVTRIGLNFGADEANGAKTGTLAATDKAGVPAVAQVNWNNLSLLTGTNTAIVADVSGTAEPTSMIVTWSSANTWSSTGRGEENNQFTGADKTLMLGYLDTGAATTTTVTIQNVPANLTFAGYDVYVYTLGGIGKKGGGYRIVDATTGAVLKNYVKASGPVNPSAYTQVIPDPAKWVEGSYIVFSGLDSPNIKVEATTAGGLGFTTTGSGDPRAPMNAIQLVTPASATPPPALGIAKTATGLSITFTGKLQTAPAVTGPWTDSTATSPLTETPTGAAKFYRSVK